MLILLLKVLRSIFFGSIGVSAVYVGICLRWFANEVEDKFLIDYAKFMSWLFVLGGFGNIIAAVLLMRV